MVALQTARPWSPRPQIEPRTFMEKGQWRVVSNGSAGCFGGWELVYPAPRSA